MIPQSQPSFHVEGEGESEALVHAGGVFPREDEITDVSGAQRVWSALPDTGLLHEAVSHAPEQRPSLGPEIREQLRETGMGIQAWIRRSALYDRIMNHFYGITARTAHAICSGSATSSSPRARTTRSGTRARTVRAVPSPARVRSPGTGRSPVCRPHRLLPDDRTGEPPNARPLLVVNRVYSGFSGVVARWAAIPALHERVDEAVTGWLHDLHPGCRVYRMSAHADWIEFQRPAVRGLPRVGWGPELAELGRAARDLRGSTISHDPSTGTLQVRDADGEPAAFAYLGVVPPRSLHAVDRILAILSDPWTLAPRRCPAATSTVPRMDRTDGHGPPSTSPC
ncbi:hypothetical protein [Streptomyces halobius]|uniref:Uncharacterized protein n=1 Tax=Streptomyces halobius TaxID=2879846 RepID=A0ABY4M466_9ACTN|nr:hypothetical protein [Streptomyces halobius]UQA92043.1 hypothetical protein K9S39_09450 [Streptomyces halobius]